MVRNLVVVVPFLFVIGVLVFAVFMVLQIDWMVNHTFYSYDLTFSLDWAVPYWAFLRTCLVLLGLAIAVVGFLGYWAYRKAERERLMPVYVCSSCGNILTSTLEFTKNTDGKPRIKTLKNCPRCNKELLEE